MTVERYALPHGILTFPIFLPDATLAVVRSLDAQDLIGCGIEAVVMNTFHLMQHPGSSTIQALKGLNAMAGWDRPIVTDSGGFQAYSLIHENAKFGYLSEKGITFQPEGSQRKFQLTPEKCVQLQVSYGSDIVICLDDCTHVDAPFADQQLSVQRTIDWARRGKREFERLVNQKRQDEKQKPRLFAVIQGGGYLELRRQCAEALLEIGFDGFGYGGWPLDSQNKLLADIIGLTRQLIPAEFPMHALGVGHPENVLACYDLGYALFDSAMPTRDARHGRLYKFNHPQDDAMAGLSGDWMDYVYIQDERYTKDPRPISPVCDCLSCSHYPAGYLHHLFKINDSAFLRLATIHNLRFMTQLCQRLRLREDSKADARPPIRL